MIPAASRVTVRDQPPYKYPVIAKTYHRFGGDRYAIGTAPAAATSGLLQGKKTPMRAEQPFGTIVNSRAGWPPSPSPSITRRGTPAALAVGVHSFEGTASRPR